VGEEDTEECWHSLYLAISLPPQEFGLNENPGKPVLNPPIAAKKGKIERLSEQFGPISGGRKWRYLCFLQV